MMLSEKAKSSKDDTRPRNRSGTKSRMVGSSSSPNDPLIAEEALTGAKRELYQFPDVCKPGDGFQYAAITSRESESLGSRVRRLVVFSSGACRNEIPEPKLPTLKLIANTEQFNLRAAIPKTGPKYIRLKSVLGLFVPLDSPQSKFSTVVVSLHDMRRHGNTVVQSCSFNSNIGIKFELSLDYCIPRIDSHVIVLNITREVAYLRKNYQWAAMKMQLKIEESTFPFVSDNQQALSVLALP